MLSSSSHLAKTHLETHTAHELVEDVLDLLTPLWQHVLRRTRRAEQHASRHKPGTRTPQMVLRVRVARNQLEVAVATVAQALLHGGALRALCENAIDAALQGSSGHHEPDKNAIAPSPSSSSATTTPSKDCEAHQLSHHTPREASVPLGAAHWSQLATTHTPRSNAKEDMGRPRYEGETYDDAELDAFLARLVATLMHVGVKGGFPRERLAAFLSTLQEQQQPAPHEDRSDLTDPAHALDSSAAHTATPDLPHGVEDGLLGRDTNGHARAGHHAKRDRIQHLQCLSTALLSVLRGVICEACELVACALASDDAAEGPPTEEAAEAQHSGLCGFEQVAAELAEARRQPGGSAPTPSGNTARAAPSLVSAPSPTSRAGADVLVVASPRSQPQQWWSWYVSSPTRTTTTTDRTRSAGSTMPLVVFVPDNPDHITLFLLPDDETDTDLPASPPASPPPPPTPAVNNELTGADVTGDAIAFAALSQLVRQSGARALRRAASASSSTLAWHADALHHWAHTSATTHRRLADAARHETQQTLFPPGEDPVVQLTGTNPIARSSIDAEGAADDDEDSEEEADVWFTSHRHPHLGFTERRSLSPPMTGTKRTRSTEVESDDEQRCRHTAWLRLCASTASPTTPSSGEASLFTSLAPLVQLPSGVLASSSPSSAPTGTSEAMTIQAEALAEVGAVLAAVDDTFSGRTILDASSWRYGRNRIPVAVLSDVYTEAMPPSSSPPDLNADAVAGDRVAFYLHETGLLYTNTGVTAALDVSEEEAM